jgi:hypothetical protein
MQGYSESKIDKKVVTFSKLAKPHKSSSQKDFFIIGGNIPHNFNTIKSNQVLSKVPVFKSN